MPPDIALLTNPAAGRGRGLRAAAVALARLREAGLSVRTLTGRDAGEALDLARAAVADGVDALVAVGGDGVVHLAVQALMQADPEARVLGVIAAGAGNDVARSLDLCRGDPARAAEAVVGRRTRRIDLARVTGPGTSSTYVVTVLAAGFDAVVNERANAMRRPRGRMRYPLATLAELRVLRPRPYTLTLDGRVRRVEAVLVAVGNGPSFGGGLRIAHGASLDDGLLDVVVVKAVGRLDLLRTYPRLRHGGHTAHPQYERHRVRSATVALSGTGVVAYADGERIGPLPLDVEAVPGAVEVLVP